MTDLVIRGGTVATADGLRQANLAIAEGSIEAVETDLTALVEGASVVGDEGWEDRLREVGRRCLWEGAQAIRISEEGD